MKTYKDPECYYAHMQTHKKEYMKMLEQQNQTQIKEKTQEMEQDIITTIEAIIPSHESEEIVEHIHQGYCAPVAMIHLETTLNEIIEEYGKDSTLCKPFVNALELSKTVYSSGRIITENGILGNTPEQIFILFQDGSMLEHWSKNTNMSEVSCYHLSVDEWCKGMDQEEIDWMKLRIKEITA